MEILGKILGSPARVRIMRLFLVNRNQNFIGQAVAKRSRTNREVVHRELRLLTSIGFTKKRGNS